MSLLLFLNNKNGSPTLRLTHIETRFINILSQIFKIVKCHTSSYTFSTEGTKIAWLLQNTALWVLKHQASVF